MLQPKRRPHRDLRPWVLLALGPVGALAAPAPKLEAVVVTAQRQAVPTLATPLSIGQIVKFNRNGKSSTVVSFGSARLPKTMRVVQENMTDDRGY